MTTYDFFSWRVTALKYFFRHRLGWQWQRRVARDLGLKFPKDVFRYTKNLHGRMATVANIEAVAIKYGFNPAGPLSLMRPPPAPVDLPSSEPESTACR